VDVEMVDVAVPVPPEEVLLVDAVLESLAEADPEAAQLVKLRFFVGLSLEEAAELMGVSTRTTDRMWVLAKAWLQRAVQAEVSGASR